MSQSEIFIKILLTILFGSILGLETETREIEKYGKVRAERDESQKLGGVRTYTVLCLFGGISGLFYLVQQYVIVYILLVAIILFVLSAYILNVEFKKAFGMTTEIAIVITFLLGFLITSSLISLSSILVILILLTFFLSQKRGIGFIIHKIEHKEVIDIISFGLIALVILPILPNHDFTISDIASLFNPHLVNLGQVKDFVIVNPFQIWLLVVLISGLNLIGYLLSKFFGKAKGLYLVGIFGGLISSTSTVITLSKQVSKDKLANSSLYTGISLISNAISFIELFIVISISSYKLSQETIPFIITLFISGLIAGIYFIYDSTKTNSKLSEEVNIEYEPFSLSPAFKFVLLIIIVKIIIQLIQLTNIPGLFLLATSLAGIVGVSAPSAATADLVQNGSLTLAYGLISFLLINLFNFIAKIYFAYKSKNKSFGNKLTIGLGFSSFILILLLIIKY